MTSLMQLHFPRAAPVAGAALVAGLALAAAACGSFSTSQATATGGAGPVSPPPNPSASTLPATGTSAPVGAGCTMLPANGRGSISSMSGQRAVTAASGNPQLSVFTSAVRKAGLDKTLNTRQGYTLVIPANSAFASLDRTQIARLRNRGNLVRVVRYHAVPSPVRPAQFASGARPVTLQGKDLTLSKTGSVYKVNGAPVLCGNIKTANATVYIVSKVLLPPG
jgi:uncharacterized surface protein with fasciclin (FAS1) repeats